MLLPGGECADRCLSHSLWSHSQGTRVSSTKAACCAEHPPSWSPASGESRWHFLKRVTTEGHTVVDAFLTVSAAQIGQVKHPRPCPQALARANLSFSTMTRAQFQ